MIKKCINLQASQKYNPDINKSENITIFQSLRVTMKCILSISIKRKRHCMVTHTLYYKIIYK